MKTYIYKVPGSKTDPRPRNMKIRVEDSTTRSNPLKNFLLSLFIRPNIWHRNEKPKPPVGKGSGLARALSILENSQLQNPKAEKLQKRKPKTNKPERIGASGLYKVASEIQNRFKRNAIAQIEAQRRALARFLASSIFLSTVFSPGSITQGLLAIADMPQAVSNKITIWQDSFNRPTTINNLYRTQVSAFPQLSPMPELMPVPEIVPSHLIHDYDGAKHVTSFELETYKFRMWAWLDGQPGIGSYSIGRNAVYWPTTGKSYMYFMQMNNPVYYAKLNAAQSIIKNVNFHRTERIRVPDPLPGKPKHTKVVTVTRLSPQDKEAFDRFREALSEFGNEEEFIRLERAFSDWRYAAPYGKQTMYQLDTFDMISVKYGLDFKKCNVLIDCMVRPAINNGPARIPEIFDRMLRDVCLTRYNGKVTDKLLKELIDSKYLTTLSPAQFAKFFYPANRAVLEKAKLFRIAKLHDDRYHEFIEPKLNMVHIAMAQKIAAEREEALAYNARVTQWYIASNTSTQGYYLDQTLATLTAINPKSKATTKVLNAAAKRTKPKMKKALSERITDGTYDPERFSEEVKVALVNDYRNITTDTKTDDILPIAVAPKEKSVRPAEGLLSKATAILYRKEEERARAA